MYEHHCSQNIKIQPFCFATQMEVAEKLTKILCGLRDICSLAQREMLCEHGKTYAEGAIYEDALGLHL